MTATRRQLLRALGGLGLAAVPLLLAPAALAAPTGALDYDLPGGAHFFTQTDGQGGASGSGYAVCNADGIPFWDFFRRAGGAAAVGYPVSHRFGWDGFVVQAFQKVVFQWRPEAGTVYYVNVLDELHNHGLDAYLAAAYQTPPPADWSADQGSPWTQVVQRHLAVLQGYPDFAAAYFAEADWLNRNGLPMTAVQDLGPLLALRCQRKVFHRWKTAVAGAPAGIVVTVNGGDIAKAAGLYPLAACTPLPPSRVLRSVVAVMGAGETTVPSADGPRFEVPVAGAPVTLPVHVLARAGVPGQQLAITLRWADGTALRRQYATIAGEDGRGLLVANLDWGPVPQPPTPPSQAATLELRDAGGTLLAQRGVTVLRADNPATRAIDLYWVAGDPANPSVLPLRTHIPWTARVAGVAIEELLWGPPAPTQIGFTSALPSPQQVVGYPGRQPGWGPRVTLRGLVIQDGVATADFSPEFWAYGGGSLRTRLIHDQIAHTRAVPGHPRGTHHHRRAVGGRPRAIAPSIRRASPALLPRQNPGSLHATACGDRPLFRTRVVGYGPGHQARLAGGRKKGTCLRSAF